MHTWTVSYASVWNQKRVWQASFQFICFTWIQVHVYMAFNYRSLQTTRRDLVKRESIPWYLIQGMKGFWQVKLIFCCKLLWIFNTDITLAIWHYLNFLVGSSVIDSWPLTRAVQDTMQVPHTHDRPISQVVLNRELNQVITMCTESHIKVLSQKSQRKNHSKTWLPQTSL